MNVHLPKFLVFIENQNFSQMFLYVFNSPTEAAIPLILKEDLNVQREEC